MFRDRSGLKLSPRENLVGAATPPGEYALEAHPQPRIHPAVKGVFKRSYLKDTTTFPLPPIFAVTARSPSASQMWGVFADVVAAG